MFFDATNVDPATSYEPLPADVYKCIITEMEEKPTKDKLGSYERVTLEVVEGKYKGRKIFDNLNLNNRNTQTVEIAKRTLSAICHAVGNLRPARKEMLYNIPMLVKVSVQIQEGYDPQNRVKGYEPAKAQTPPTAAQPRTQASSGAAGVWGNKGRQPQPPVADDEIPF